MPDRVRSGRLAIAALSMSPFKTHKRWNFSPQKCCWIDMMENCETSSRSFGSSAKPLAVDGPDNAFDRAFSLASQAGY